MIGGSAFSCCVLCGRSGLSSLFWPLNGGIGGSSTGERRSEGGGFGGDWGCSLGERVKDAMSWAMERWRYSSNSKERGFVICGCGRGFRVGNSVDGETKDLIGDGGSGTFAAAVGDIGVSKVGTLRFGGESGGGGAAFVTRIVPLDGRLSFSIPSGGVLGLVGGRGT